MIEQIVEAEDDEVRKAFDYHVKSDNLPSHIKNGDYRSAWVRQAWVSFYAGWRMSEQHIRSNK